MISPVWRLAVLAAGLSACTADEPTAEREPPTGPTADAPLDSPGLVDPSIPAGVAGEEGWNFHQSAVADLTGDGRAERIVLSARVELYRGRPAWDDGQPWQVYVEEQDGSRTRVYAQRLQLGALTMRIALDEPDRPPAIILLEHLPDRLRIFEVSYAGPDEISVAERFRRNLDPTGETASPHLP